MTPAEREALAERMIPVACDLACMVRDGDADGIAALQSRLTLPEAGALLVVLAAMVPVEDSSAGDLLEWTGTLEASLRWRQDPLPMPGPGRPVTEPCGTYAGWCRHKRRGERVDRACDRAWRQYRAERRIVRKEIAAREESDAAAA